MKTDSFLTGEDIHKKFDETPALAGVSFELARGQILCLLGPSGCGKTTLLRIIAGLERPDRGRILFEGRDIGGVPPHKRDFGLMFQEFALFPHKTVGENIAFGLQMQHHQALAGRVEAMLALVGLAGFANRDTNSLSGGERQRVALARSLAPRPRLLMLDEPLGALDRALRDRLMLEIRQILKQVGLTAIYVTHDQTEAFGVADRVIVMNEGRIEQAATPPQLYHRPATPFVARFLGFTNLLEATCRDEGQLETGLGQWPVPAATDRSPGEAVTALIRPEAASFSPAKGDIVLRGRLTASLFRGRFYRVTLEAAGESLTFELSTEEPPEVGSEVTVEIDPAAILLLDR